MTKVATRVALAAAVITMLGLMGPAAARADDTGGDEDEEEQPVRPAERRPPPPPPARTETRTETRTMPVREYEDDDCDVRTFASDRSLAGRDTVNIFGPDSDQTWRGPANDRSRSGRRSSLTGPHGGYWRAQSQPVAVIASFSTR
jgi:hypothetical protein